MAGSPQQTPYSTSLNPGTAYNSQVPPNYDAINNGNKTAVNGYNWDAVKGSYVPTVGSAPDQIAQRDRTQKQQDTRFDQGTQAFNQFMNLPNTMSGLFGSTGNIQGAQPVPAVGGYPSLNSGSLPAASMTPIPTPPRTQVGSGATADQLKGAQDAAYADAKDKAAGTAQGAMRGLQENLSSRGMGGGGYEAGQIGQTLGREANTIGDTYKQFTQDQYNKAYDTSALQANIGSAERGQDINSGLTGRGQDITYQNNIATQGLSARGQDVTQRGQDITQRGQDIDQNQFGANIELQKQLAALNALSGLYNNTSRSLTLY